tara:strand:- start:1613 stop:1795 length:183 start_codon:yes stop_codon:yes gene_type:complete
MDEIYAMDRLKRAIEERREQISEMLMSGALKDIEHYKYLQGELAALYYIESYMRESVQDS